MRTPGSLAAGRALDTPRPCAPAELGAWFSATTIRVRCAGKLDSAETGRKTGPGVTGRGEGGMGKSAQPPSRASSRAARRRAPRRQRPWGGRLERPRSDHPLVARRGSPWLPLCTPSPTCGAARDGARRDDEKGELSSKRTRRWGRAAPRPAEGWRGPAATVSSSNR